MEPLSYLAKLRKICGFWIKTLGNKSNFKLASNLKGVQTFDERFHKFTKNIFWHDLQYCEFRLTHLYSKFEVLLQVANGLNKKIQKSSNVN
jgi:hypothetical protein